MRGSSLLCLVATSLVALTAAENSKGPIWDIPDGPHPPDDEKWCYHPGPLARANTLFAAAFYKKIAASSSTLNIVTSPFSVSAALAMTYAGARGKTRSQMRSALEFSTIPPECKVHEGFRRILKKFTEPRYNHSIKVAVRVFVERRFRLLPRYLAFTKKYYGVRAMWLPFQSLPEQSLATINNWVSEATNGKFTDVMNPPGVTSDTKLVLVNAITFEGRWRHEFPPWRTRRERFYKSSTRYVDMMHTSIKSPYLRYASLRSIGARIVELPYGRSLVSMYVVLPNWNTNLFELERAFKWNPEKIRMIFYRMDVSLPRFTVHQHVKLDSYLKSMGMTDMFTSSADLSGIDGSRDLSVDPVIHEAYINVTETGTTASAAGTNSKARGAHRFIKGYRFTVNRPFLFFIWDYSTKSLLFTGRFLV